MTEIAEQVFNHYGLDCPKTISAATTRELFRRIAIEKKLIAPDTPPINKKSGRKQKWGNSIYGFEFWATVKLEMLKNGYTLQQAIYELIRTPGWAYGKNPASLYARFMGMRKSVSFMTKVLAKIKTKQVKIDFLEEMLANFNNDDCVYMDTYPNPYLAMLDTEIKK